MHNNISVLNSKNFMNYEILLHIIIVMQIRFKANLNIVN